MNSFYILTKNFKRNIFSEDMSILFSLIWVAMLFIKPTKNINKQNFCPKRILEFRVQKVLSLLNEKCQKLTDAISNGYQKLLWQRKNLLLLTCRFPSKFRILVLWTVQMNPRTFSWKCSSSVLQFILKLFTLYSINVVIEKNPVEFICLFVDLKFYPELLEKFFGTFNIVFTVKENSIRFGVEFLNHKF